MSCSLCYFRVNELTLSIYLLTGYIQIPPPLIILLTATVIIHHCGAYAYHWVFTMYVHGLSSQCSWCSTPTSSGHVIWPPSMRNKGSSFVIQCALSCHHILMRIHVHHCWVVWNSGLQSWVPFLWRGFDHDQQSTTGQMLVHQVAHIPCTNLCSYTTVWSLVCHLDTRRLPMSFPKDSCWGPPILQLMLKEQETVYMLER